MVNSKAERIFTQFDKLFLIRILIKLNKLSFTKCFFFVVFIIIG